MKSLGFPGCQETPSSDSAHRAAPAAHRGPAQMPGSLDPPAHFAIARDRSGCGSGVAENTTNLKGSGAAHAGTSQPLAASCLFLQALDRATDDGRHGAKTSGRSATTTKNPGENGSALRKVRQDSSQCDSI